jgi:decaprenyl-phosphate phosphoribosyltransferase
MIISLISILRPKQWVKNLLILLGPIAGGSLFANIQPLLIGVVGFIFASSLGYVINDWLDRNFDALHNTKKYRPFASGALKQVHLISLCVFCLVGLSICSFFLGFQYTFCLSLYLILTLSYSLYIKNIAVVELMILSFGFLIRGITGTIIVEIAPSGWFLLSILFGALLVVTCKRISELNKSSVMQTRKVLINYNKDFLNILLNTSLTGTIITYSLWVLESHPDSILAQFTIILILTFFLRYVLLLPTGDLEEPEKVLFSDYIILSSVILLILFFTIMQE